MAMLEISGLSKRYRDGARDRVVLADATVEIDREDFVGLWGLRRSGKSTLLRIIAGLEPADAGSLRLDGVELTSLLVDERVRLIRDYLGLASFGLSSYRNRQVCEHVAVAAAADGRTTGRSARALARRALNRLEVLDCAERWLDQLSFDEQIRVELARAIVRSPRLLLIDDPPALQSPREDGQLRELVTSLGNDSGRAVVLASSDVGVVQRASRMMAIGQGRLRTMDEPGVVVPFPDRTGTDGS